jgi:hypothetical protein
MQLMHFLAIAAGGIRAALFSSGPPSLSFSSPSEMPGLPSLSGRLSLTVQEEFVANQKIICLLSVSSFAILIG